MSLDKLLPAQRNDLLRAFDDHTTFCRESLVVADRGGSNIPFECWPSQLKLTRAIQKQRKQGKPVRIRVLKTRRSGFTLGSCSHLFKETAFWPGRRAMIIADHYDPAAIEAFSYIRRFSEGYKPFERFGVPIKAEHLRAADMALYRDGDSPEEPTLSVYSADKGEIRGGGRHLALFDEVAFWRNAALTIRAAGVMVPDLPETMIIEQSTANGQGDEWWQRCQSAMDPATAGGWAFVFFGWLEDPNLVMRFEDREGAVRLQRNLDSEEHVLHTVHHATLEQLNWRRWKILTHFNGRVEDFHQEYPTTPQEAFISSGRPALDPEGLSKMVATEGMSGELVEEQRGPRKMIFFRPRPGGALTIWARPQPNHEYVIGADPAKGVDVSETKRGSDPDYSVAWVAERYTGQQVALLRGRIRPAPFADLLALMGRLYNDAFLVPEANDAGFIDALIRTKYPIGLIYNRHRSPTDQRSEHPQDIGFMTDGITRPWLVTAFDEAIRNENITIESAVAIQECHTFVIKPNGKAEHQVGCHDDCVISGALMVMGMRFAPRKLAAAKGGVIRYGGKKKRPDYDD